MKYNHIHTAKKKRNAVLKRIAYKKKKIAQNRLFSMVVLSAFQFLPLKYKEKLTKLTEAKLMANIVKGLSKREIKYYLKKVDEYTPKINSISDLWAIDPL